MTEYDEQRNLSLSVQEKERSIAAANQNSAIARVINIVYFLFGLLELLLALRVILHVAGANPRNGFAVWIYGLSAPFLTLFEGLLKNPAVNTGAVLEITTLIAMFVYGILSWLVTRLIWLMLSRPR